MLYHSHNLTQLNYSAHPAATFSSQSGLKNNLIARSSLKPIFPGLKNHREYEQPQGNDLDDCCDHSKVVHLEGR